MARQTAKEKRTALYCRLSKDDGNYGESSSIQTQKEILKRYANENGFRNITYYVDDGYSGTNFNRPDFKRMIGDIENGEIATVITKDLSRLGRNYLETGIYLEMYFPEHNVRYIAVNDSVDTIHSESVDFTPYRNLANELMARDTSQKVHSAKRARCLAGMYVGGQAPFGYCKDPDDHHRLIVDEEHAPTIRLIFGLAKDGKSIAYIRRHVNTLHLLRPGAANPYGHEWWPNGEDDPKRYIWNNNTVRNILRNPVYAGHLATNKRIKPSFKSKKTFSVLPENYIIVRDTHEPIVPPEDFDLVQKLITNRRFDTESTVKWENIFSGVIRCEECGYAMNKTRAHRGRKENPIDEYVFLCSTYKSYGRERCGSHAIEARDVYDTVLEDILRLAEEALDDDGEMVKRILDRMGADREKQSGLIADELKEKRSRLSEIDMLFKKLYEDKVNGVISDRNFQMMNGKYEEEQNGLQKRIDEMKALMAEEDSRTENAGQFVKLIREYAKISSLDAALITTLIEKVIIGKSIKADGKTTRDIKIYYKNVGNIS